MVEIEKKEVPAISTEMPIAYSAQELLLQIVRTSVIQGFSTAIGIAAKDVSIDKVNPSTKRARRLQDTSNVEIIVALTDPDTTLSQLEEDIKQAAQEGSIVANVKAAAARNGALTSNMKKMEEKIDVEKIKTAQTVTEINFPSIKVGAPSNTPTNAPTPQATKIPQTSWDKVNEAIKKAKESCDTGCKAGAAAGAIAGAALMGIACYCVKKSSAKQPPASSPPVLAYNVEEHLAGSNTV
jgi:hypothetical protein